MDSWKKIAAVAGLLGGLVAAGAGAAQAGQGGSVEPECTRDAQGNVRCVQEQDRRYVTEDGTFHVRQNVDCSSSSRTYTYNYGTGRWEQVDPKTGTNCSTRVP
ncbi:hypothetical protein IHE55_19955 [Streptomyces pactum]|uniref:Secreted protein n=1 Tax=Streptomyces pactum TaxID=68249 RepID=A0ABS0NNY5_9ACTN|nr:hypothetical protein [Streptomyces pactum]MBH5336915.1 hypothetical protein [Streptomyces pactum]